MKAKGMKRILSVLLSLVMVLGLMPMTAQAASYDGNEVTNVYSKTVDGLGTTNQSYIYIYTTDQNDIKVTEEDLSTGYKFKLEWDSTQWYFDGWQTWFEGGVDIPLWFDEDVSGSNPIFEDGERSLYSFFNVSMTSPYQKQSNYIVVRQGPDYYGNYSLYAIFKPIVTIEAEGVTYDFSPPNANKISDNKYGVKFKDDVKITYTIDEGYVFQSVGVSGTKYYDTSTDGVVTLTDTEKPTSIGINTRLKQQEIKFDANSGSGEMAMQTFNYGKEKALTANRFTKEGYTFTGWKDASGNEYTDEESVTFLPETDGARITLYAQWSQNGVGEVIPPEIPEVSITNTPASKPDLVDNGQEQELISAGSVTGGKMQYVLGTDGAPVGEWSDAIPTASDAGTYYVWYRVVDDEGEEVSAPVCIAVTIAEAAEEEPPVGGETSANKPKRTKKYDSVIKQAKHGDVEVDDDYAKRGQEITITVDPDKGYELDELIIIDQYGDEVDYEDGKKENTFIFEMPKSDVTIEASFEKVDEDTEESEEKEEQGEASAEEQKEIILTIDSRIVQVDGEFIINDVAPVIKDGRTFLPVRIIAEELGAAVVWDAATQTVTITKGSTEIVISIGQPFAMVNGEPVQLDASAFIEAGRTFLPIRFIAENLGAEVTWNGADRTVTIIG